MTKLRSAVLSACALTLAACGDADTNDPRGYTKAPLENPGWTIEAEAPGGMAALGEPIRLPSMDTLAIDTTAAAAQTGPQTTNPPPPAASTAQ